MTQPTTGSNYTPDEIQAVVEKLVLATISRPIDTLGVARTDLTFNDIQQAAANVFILYPNSPFYVLFLGVQRVRDLVTSEQSLVAQLLSSLQVLGRQVLPVDDVSPLFNIQASLQALASAAAQRSSTLDVTKAPAYQQFTTNSASFLAGPAGSAVKSGGNIVQTPQQARTAIPGLLSQLSQAHASLVATITSLVGGIDDFNSVNLPSVVAESVLSNSASLVGADAKALSSLSPADRLADIRQVVLNLLATKAVVTAFGTFNGPSDFYSLTGLGRAYSDAQHLATPAAAVAQLPRAAGIIAGSTDTLTLAPDGGAPFSITLNPSFLAELDGMADDSGFVIGDGTAPPAPSGGQIANNNKLEVLVGGTLFTATLTNSNPPEEGFIAGTGNTTTAGWYGGGGLLDGKTFIIVVDGTTTYTVTLSAPANAGALISQINTVTNVITAAHRAFAFDSGVLNLSTLTVGTGGTISIGAGTANSILGFTPGQSTQGTNSPRTADQVAADIQAAMPAGVTAESYYSPLKFSGKFDIPAGTNATWTLTGGAVADLVALGVGDTDSVTVPSGPDAGTYPITAVTSTSITVTGVTTAAPGTLVQIGPAHKRVRIRCSDPASQLPVETTLGVTSSDTPSANALTTLGFTNNMVSSTMRSTPDNVANDINSKTQLVKAATLVTTPVTVATAHTSLTDPNLVVFSEAGVTGNAAFAGPVVTLTVTAVTLAGAISTGDKLVFRSTANAPNAYTITTINGQSAQDHQVAAGDVVVATGSFSGTSIAAAQVEFGPTFTLAKYMVVTISSGPNKGTFFVSGQGASPIDVELITSLGQNRDVSTNLPLSMSASLGDIFLTLSSLNTTTSSEVVVSGTAAALYFTTPPFTQVGSSEWFFLPSIPRGLQAGDILEYYPTQYNVPSLSFVIDQVVAELSVIQVSADVSGVLPPDTASWQFTPQPVPFARLRVGIHNDFTTVQTALQGWLANPVNQPLFFQNYNRLVNPLLANQNPTAAQVGAAVSTLESFFVLLSEAEASAQAQDPTLAIDSILATYTVEPVAPVDTLVQTFTEKGADLAIDTLLKGQFSGFFGLSMDGTSYAGAFQAATRAVAMNDLPVRKMSRPEAQTSQLTGQAQSPDFEYTANSMTEQLQGEQPNPPTSPGTPSNFGSTTGSVGSGNQ